MLERDRNVYLTKAISGKNYLGRLLDRAGLPRHLTNAETIILKPNLVEALDPPITTPVQLIDDLVIYLQSLGKTKIVVAEGCGAVHYDTFHAFDQLGYTTMADKRGVELIDLNEADLTRLSREDCRRWPEMYLPQIALYSFLISVPVLKAHTLAEVTLTMKNMMGLAPPAHYQEGGTWKKSAFHRQMHEAVADLNRYRTPDFTILDATVGMPEAHLWGPICDPPIGILAAGCDPVAMDAFGAGLLDRDWREIGHIRQTHRELGLAEPLELIDIG